MCNSATVISLNYLLVINRASSKEVHKKYLCNSGVHNSEVMLKLLFILFRAKFKNIEETEKAKQDLVEDMKTK